MRLRVLLFLFLLLAGILPADAVSLFYVANAGTYSGNITDTNHWSTTSGGAGGHAVPTNADDVFMDGAGATGGDKTITWNGSQAWRSFDMTGGGVAGIAISHSAAVTITVGGTGSTGFKMEVGGTYTAVNASTSQIALTATASVSKSFTSAGYTFGQIINNNNGTAFWQLADTLNVSTLTFTGGTFSTNGQTVNATVAVNGSNNNTKTVTITNSTINCSANSGNVWTFTQSTGTTLNASGSVININGNGNRAVQYGATALTYGTVNITGTGIITTTLAAAGTTFANYNHTSPSGTASATENLAGGNMTVTGTLTLAGNSATARLGFMGVNLGSGMTVMAAAVALSFVDIEGVTAAGAASPFTGTSLGNAGGNSNITFDSPLTLYYVGDINTWSNVNAWALASGGTGGAGTRVPLVGVDQVLFDNNSWTTAAATVTMDMLRYGDMDFSAITVGGTTPPNFRFSLNIEFYGNWTLTPAFTGFFSWDNTSGGTIFWKNMGTKTWTNNTDPVGTGTTILCPGGTVQFSGDVVNHSTITLTSGTLDAGTANTISIRSGFITAGALTRVLNMKNANWLMNGNVGGSVWTASGTNLTINPGNSTITYDSETVNSASYTFAGGGFTYANFHMAHTVSAGASIVFTGANTFTGMLFDPNVGGTITLPASTTTTAAAFVANGTSSSHTVLNSSSSGTPATISVLSGNQISNYVDIKDSTATGGATFYARGSVNTSGNTGWNFGDVPGAGMFLLAK